MDEFLKLVKLNDISHDEANKEIIDKLMIKNCRLSEKIKGDIDAYDSESLFGEKIYRGNIYIFEYLSKYPTKYSYLGDDVYFTDNMPVVLMLGETASTIYGINLNFCNKGLKTLILNLITNLDEEFYFNGLDLKLAANKNLVISKNVYTFLSDQKSSAIIKEFLNAMYQGIDYNVIFRNYAIDGIKNIRLIEPWQWKYIPYLNFEGSLKRETLEAIQKISGINKIIV